MGRYLREALKSLDGSNARKSYYYYDIEAIYRRASLSSCIEIRCHNIFVLSELVLGDLFSNNLSWEQGHCWGPQGIQPEISSLLVEISNQAPMIFLCRQILARWKLPRGMYRLITLLPLILSPKPSFSSFSFTCVEGYLETLTYWGTLGDSKMITPIVNLHLQLLSLFYIKKEVVKSDPCPCHLAGTCPWYSSLITPLYTVL